MSVTMTVNGLDAVQAWASELHTTMTQAAAAAVLDVSQDVASKVEIAMPVDTGWAQARWGNPEMYGFWEVSDDGLQIEQGSDLSMIDKYEYIIRLNEGSSQQAPAGFIDVLAENGGDKLEAQLNEIADRVD